MNTTANPPLSFVRNGVRLLTIADVAVLPDQLPSGPVRYELHDGRLIVHLRPQPHNRISSLTCFAVLVGDLLPV